MSTTAGTDRKRKTSDVGPGSFPVPKHTKAGNTGTMASAGMNGNLAATQRLAQLQQLVNAQPGMTEETKRKYMSGLDGLQATIEKNSIHSQERQVAQNKYDTIVNKLTNTLRQVQQAQLQQQQQQQHQQYQHQAQQQVQQQGFQQNGGGIVNNGAMPGVGPNAGAPVTGNLINHTSRSNWIVPSTVPPANADQWRADIKAKLTQVNQKANHARAQITILQQSLQQPSMTPEQQREIQNRIAENTQQYNHFKEIINKFGQQQQKMLQQQQQQQQQIMLQVQQARAGQQQSQQGQIAMQKPVQQGMVPEAHNPSQQQGTMQQSQQQQANTGNNVQQNPQSSHPQQQQQPLQSTNPMQQQRPQQQQTPQPTLHVMANTHQQRITTPIQRVDSPPGPGVNSAANRATMSPVAQQPPMQQPTQQPQPQQQQPQQQGQVVRPAVQPPSQQQQPTVPGRSSIPPVTAATSMAQPNSPAPRAGSVQPGARPSTASGTPVSATTQQPGQPQPQGQPQQPQPQQRMQPASSASTASPTTNTHPTQTTRDTAQGHRLPIPKSLTISTPQPISVPAARPTLSGGMNSSGNQMMNTPAIIKQPAFEFDEGGMGLLSKRKLEELVKQIDPEEKLDPDVEESILELVDEFIDNIATTACKMAKLRGSDTLDIKDIQIILERNWNIRIPGYAADDIRTVRKFNPAPGYHQKMATLAAHKQLNQAAGKGGD